MTDTSTLPKITEANPASRPYQPFGGALEILYAKDPEVLICGPAGTGKTRGNLEKLHLCMSKYPGARGLMVRKTRESLTQSGMVTFQNLVVPDNGSVVFRTAEQEYRYSNKSVVVLGGMDKSSKIMSTDYDLIVVLEATELDLDDWEALTTRARYGIMPYNQVIGDCNPGPARHWLKLRAEEKALHRGKPVNKLRYIESVHQDNPVYYDHATKTWTEQGLDYLEKLDRLTGVRYKRLRLGLWVTAEGMIYDEWDPEKHLLNRDAVRFPRGWPRVWSIDFGFTRPFVWACWVVDPETNAMYRTWELYHTKILVEDACVLIKAWKRNNNEPDPEAIVCDWDAEDRATFERHMGLATTPAGKDVSPGIQAVKTRLRTPSLFYLRDAQLERDYDLEDAKLPMATEEEFDSYEWEEGKRGEQPKKLDDHGMDQTRYAVDYVDNSMGGWSQGPARS